MPPKFLFVKLIVFILLAAIIPISKCFAACGDGDDSPDRYRFCGAARTADGMVALLEKDGDEFIVRQDDTLNDGARVKSLNYSGAVISVNGEDQKTAAGYLDNSPYIIGPLKFSGASLDAAVLKLSSSSGGACIVTSTLDSDEVPVIDMTIAHVTLIDALDLISEETSINWLKYGDCYLLFQPRDADDAGFPMEDENGLPVIAGPLALNKADVTSALKLISVAGNVEINLDLNADVSEALTHIRFSRMFNAVTVDNAVDFISGVACLRWEKDGGGYHIEATDELRDSNSPMVCDKAWIESHGGFSVDNSPLITGPVETECDGFDSAIKQLAEAAGGIQVNFADELDNMEVTPEICGVFSKITFEDALHIVSVLSGSNWTKNGDTYEIKPEDFTRLPFQ
jgi:hypothetical protein